MTTIYLPGATIILRRLKNGKFCAYFSNAPKPKGNAKTAKSAVACLIRKWTKHAVEQAERS